jgi:hypothetical protein
MRRSHVPAWTLIAAIGLFVSVSVAAQTPTRDGAKPAAVGTASITGTIVSDDADARPLRRVRVGVMSSDRQVSRTVVTDDEGRFNFVALPAGRYILTANKQGYVSAAYGARRPNRPGTALVLADGQRITGLTLRMTRGSAISGVLVDHNGEPFSGANVSAMRNTFVGSGQRSLVPVASAVSDDRGQYRLWGLAAGDYVISANAGFASQTRDNDIARLTDADIKRAMLEVALGSARPGGPSDGSADPEVRPLTVGYAAVFYPGTPVAAQAIPIKLGAAEERTGVDFPMALVHTAKVEGSIVVPDGVNPQTVSVQLIGSAPQGFTFDMFRRSAPTKDGTFTFAGVPPGPYAVLAQAQPSMKPAGPSLPPAGPPRPSHWARADIVVDGQDIVDVSLALRPGLTVAGRIQFEGTSAPPSDLSRIRISMLPVQAQGEVSLGQAQIQPEAAGSFTIHGLTPGRYRLMANVPSARPDANPWQLKSSVVQGRETVDMPIDLRDGADDAVITFTDRVSELSGLVQDAGGQPAPEYHIVLFARDKAYWTPTSRRLRTVRPAADGKYVIGNLPPGDYLMTAVTDMEQGEQFDPAFLEVLSRSAIAVAIAEGEKKTQDLRLNRQQP